ncbi:MAG: hypothetical protein ACP6IY_17470 [Promethearchaeia archaeon]
MSNCRIACKIIFEIPGIKKKQEIIGYISESEILLYDFLQIFINIFENNRIKNKVTLIPKDFIEEIIALGESDIIFPSDLSYLKESTLII